jgi:hypothetical protein
MIKKMDAIRFAIDYSAVRTAYLSSREGLRERSKAAETITRKSWGLEPGEELPSEPDENGWSLKDDFWAQVGEVEHESGAADEIIREAFIIGLFHLWERHANRWCTTNNYVENEAFAQLELIGRQPKKDALVMLRLLANCLKHGRSLKPNGACNQLCLNHPYLFKLDEGGAGTQDVPSSENLSITEQLVEDMFQAVIQSGPPGSSFHESWQLMS